MISTQQVWVDYGAALKRFLHSRVSNPADVDDLLQDILLKTHKNLADLQNSQSIQAWLFRVARNATIDHYRKQGRIIPDTTDLWYDDDIPDSQQDLEGCVSPFIAALPKDQADLLQAIDVDGAAQKEYAELHGIAYSTLKSRVKAARVALRARFDDCCHLSLDENGAVLEYSPKQGKCGPC